MGKQKLFTEEQEKYILDNYCTMNNKELADILGVNRSQVNSWLIHHGIKRNGAGGYYNQIFTESDINFIRDNYAQMTCREIGKILGFTGRQIQGKVNKLNLAPKKRIINENYFDQIDTSLKAYILGFIYADGWVIYNKERANYEFGMMLQAQDKYVLDMINAELGGNNLISQIDPRDINCNGIKCHSNEAFSLRVFSKKIVQDLMKHGITTKKSTKDVYPIIDEKYFFDFLRGYIDGDGCYYTDGKYTYMHITAASKEPLKYIQKQLSAYNISTKIYSESQKKYRLMCVNTEEMQKLINRLYYNGDLFYLQRKFQKIKHFLGLTA